MKTQGTWPCAWAWTPSVTEGTTWRTNMSRTHWTTVYASGRSRRCKSETTGCRCGSRRLQSGGTTSKTWSPRRAVPWTPPATLVCKNKKKLMGFSKESYELGDLLRVQKGELPDPDGANK